MHILKKTNADYQIQARKNYKKKQNEKVPLIWKNNKKMIMQ